MFQGGRERVGDEACAVVDTLDTVSLHQIPETGAVAELQRCQSCCCSDIRRVTSFLTLTMLARDLQKFFAELLNDIDEAARATDVK